MDYSEHDWIKLLHKICSEGYHPENYKINAYLSSSNLFIYLSLFLVQFSPCFAGEKIGE